MYEYRNRLVKPQPSFYEEADPIWFLFLFDFFVFLSPFLFPNLIWKSHSISTLHSLEQFLELPVLWLVMSHAGHLLIHTLSDLAFRSDSVHKAWERTLMPNLKMRLQRSFFFHLRNLFKVNITLTFTYVSASKYNISVRKEVLSELETFNGMKSKERNIAFIVGQSRKFKKNKTFKMFLRAQCR